MLRRVIALVSEPDMRRLTLAAMLFVCGAALSAQSLTSPNDTSVAARAQHDGQRAADDRSVRVDVIGGLVVGLPLGIASARSNLAGRRWLVGAGAVTSVGLAISLARRPPAAIVAVPAGVRADSDAYRRAFSEAYAQTVSQRRLRATLGTLITSALFGRLITQLLVSLSSADRPA